MDNATPISNPGNAILYSRDNIVIIDGEPSVESQTISWERPDGEIVDLGDGSGGQKVLDDNFVAAWVREDGNLDYFREYEWGSGSEVTLEQYKPRGSKWGGYKDDSRGFYEYFYEYDLDNDGQIGRVSIEGIEVPELIDTSLFLEPDSELLNSSDFEIQYNGTNLDDEVFYSEEYSADSLLASLLGGDDKFESYASIKEIGIDGGSDNDSIHLWGQEEKIHIIDNSGRNEIDISNSTATEIKVYTGAGRDGIHIITANDQAPSVSINSGNGDDSISMHNDIYSDEDVTVNGLIWLGDGDDRASIEASTTSAVNVIGGEGDDYILVAGNYSDNWDNFISNAGGVVVGGEGDDELAGYHVSGGTGSDVMKGIFVELSNGNDVVEFEPWLGERILIDAEKYGSDHSISRNENGEIAIKGNGLNTTLSWYVVDEYYEDYNLLDMVDDSIIYINGNEDSGPGPTYQLPITTSSLEGTESNDKLRGKKSNDSILGLGGNDKLNGKKGDDILEGGEGNDTLKGAKGDDYLLGSQGVDILIGGKGADVFKTSKGGDVVNDFNLTQGDRVGLNQETEYEVIDDVDGTLIRVSDDVRMLLLDQDYDEFLAAGNDAIARIAV